MDVRVPRPRRRRLRVALPGAEPHRLPGSARRRVGGLREWIASGARPTPPAFLRRTDFAPSSLAFDAAFQKTPMTEHIGVGMLGYAFMGKAHSNAFRTLAYMTWPPPLVPDLVAIGGRNAESGAGGGRALRLRERGDRLARDRRRPAGRCLRQPLAEQPARRAVDRGRGGRQARRLREAARAQRRRGVRDVAARAGRRRRAHVRVQLPLRARDPPRARDARGGRARRDPPLPRLLPAGLADRSVRPGDLAARRRRGGLRRAGRPRRAHHRPRPIPGRRDRVGGRD